MTTADELPERLMELATLADDPQIRDDLLFASRRLLYLQGLSRRVIELADARNAENAATIEQIDGERLNLKTILQHLVRLKEHKDKHGKDAYYELHQPSAWDAARDALGKGNA